MTSQKQIAANRRNAQKSTGPRSPEGKSIVAQNATTHGFTANTPIIPGEDPTAYGVFKSQLIKELNPQGPTEIMLVERIIDLSWRLKRSGRLHIDAYRVFSEDTQSTTDSNTDCGHIAVRDFAGDKVFERLLIHERRIENSLFKTITELQRIQFIRTKYQSLLMDGEDYDDYEMRDITVRHHAADLETQSRENLKKGIQN